MARKNINAQTLKSTAPAALVGVDTDNPTAPGYRYTPDGVAAMIGNLLNVVFVKPGQSIQTACDALASTGGTVFLLPGTHTALTAAVGVPAKVVVQGCGIGVTVVPMANPELNGFVASGVANAAFRDFSITCATAGTSAYVAGILICNGANNCSVRRVKMDGITWGGVVVWDADHNLVEDCEFVNWRGSVQDSADINFYRSSNYNTAQNNRCYGGGDFGVGVYNPYTLSTPTGNKVIGNRIGQHRSYGVMVYIGDGTPYDSRTLVQGNNIKDIQGAGGGGGVAAGTGIYLAGAGGVRVIANQVNDCTQATTNFGTLGAAGITVNGAVGYPVVLEGNEVTASRGPCFSVVSSSARVTLSGNTGRAMNASSAFSGNALTSTNSPGLKTIGNTWIQDRADIEAVFIQASGMSVADIKMLGDTVDAAGYGINLYTIAGGAFDGVDLIGVTSRGASILALDATNVTSLRISGGEYSGSLIAARITDCPRFRISGAHIKSSWGGGAGLAISGTCTNSIVDETTDIDMPLASNAAGSGAVISQFGDAAPTTGTWAIGDRVIRRTAAVGSAKGWRCTTAGTPGTWTSEGNL